MDTVRIGYVKYLNTLPLVEGLGVCRDLELVAAVPSKLAPMLRGGEVEIALASLVDLAKSAESDVPLALLPAGMIGCDGPTLTVRLFSRMPLEQVMRLHADTDSHTSVILAQLLLRKRFGAKPIVVDFDARERIAVGEGGDEDGEWPETLLMIGDKVVTDSPPAVRYPYQLDLGEAWHAWTGLPFVYAVWMCRAADAEGQRVQAAVALLDRQRLRNTARLDWIVQRYATERRWPRDLARRYVEELLRYAVGPREREAVERFLSECASEGLLPVCAAKWVEGVFTTEDTERYRAMQKSGL
ncbi:MAG: menaquinone biosynthetic enzyme MqnA/MqnD family protein [Phycisphaerales bacterium]